MTTRKVARSCWTSYCLVKLVLCSQLGTESGLVLWRHSTTGPGTENVHSSLICHQTGQHCNSCAPSLDGHTSTHAGQLKLGSGASDAPWVWRVDLHDNLVQFGAVTLQGSAILHHIGAPQELLHGHHIHICR
eukprot:482242-Amphidinium_carterae.1